MELVTGHSGTDHISAADIAAMIRGAYGDGDYVLTLDDDMSCTAASANTIEIGKGGCLIQGHFCRVETAEQVTIESGSPGYYRNDLIVARYTLGDGNIQDVYLAVIKGVATTSSTPSDPSYTEGDIDGGSTLAEFPLWRIPISGVNVGTPERVMPLAGALQDEITQLGESVSRFDLLSATSVRFGCFSKGTASLEFFMPEGSGIYCYALIIQTTGGQQLQWRKYTSETSYTVLWTK